MYQLSTQCMDLLVNKPDFPDYAFVLHEDGWSTHHIVVERQLVKLGHMSARGAKRVNHGPSKTGQFNKEYAEKVFDYMEKRKRRENLNVNTNELAIIPFGDREKEILFLGTVQETAELQGGIKVTTLNYIGRSRKTIKIYSPPFVWPAEYKIPNLVS